MSTQYETGDEKIGLNNAQANSLYNSNLVRALRRAFESETFDFPAPLDGDESVPSVRDYDRVVKWVQITVGDPLALPDDHLEVRLVVNEAVLSQAFLLAPSTNYSKVAVVGNGNGGSNPFATLAEDPFSGPGVIVPAAQKLQSRIAAAHGARLVKVTPIWRSRVI